MKRIIVAAAAAAVFVTSGCGAAQASARPVPVDPPAQRCVTFVVAGQAGLSWDEPVTFCGRGLQSGSWQCPAKTPALGPGTRLACTRIP